MNARGRVRTMLRFLKERLRSSPKLVPPTNPTQQTTETDAERHRDFGSECGPGKISVDEAGGTDSMLGPDIKHEDIVSRVVNQEAAIEIQQLPMANVPRPTPSNTGGNSSE